MQTSLNFNSYIFDLFEIIQKNIIYKIHLYFLLIQLLKLLFIKIIKRYFY